ncbi:RelA/SpoT domain-containing protein [Brevundimonas diminuta]|uniref:RelA/SpoT domain-containing protein n=1 Tax=Brevundimonas diminuta TaxID=293 RepID=UPI003F819DB7
MTITGLAGLRPPLVERENVVVRAYYHWLNGAEGGEPMSAVKATYPGGSKSRVNRAGRAIRENAETIDDLVTINVWRAAHKPVLNTFQSILRNRTRYTDTVVVQRHKRKSTIFGKLNRFPTMELSRMDDVAGCRLIFKDIASLYDFRERIHRARFRHTLRNSVDKYDYIKNPKSTGYRGIHDVYEYDANSATGVSSKGLLIELQYRTTVQHAWATAVEVIGFITSSQPKFQEGDKRYEDAMTYASEILARAHEARTSYLHHLSDDEVLQGFIDLDHELNLMTLLRSLNAADAQVQANRNVILIFSDTEELQTESYNSATEALRRLFVLEQQNPGKDIVLVRGDSGDDVRTAFRNYFSDAREFIDLVERGCQHLAGDRVIKVDFPA